MSLEVKEVDFITIKVMPVSTFAVIKSFTYKDGCTISEALASGLSELNAECIFRALETQHKQTATKTEGDSFSFRAEGSKCPDHHVFKNGEHNLQMTLALADKCFNENHSH